MKKLLTKGNSYAILLEGKLLFCKCEVNPNNYLLYFSNTYLNRFASKWPQFLSIRNWGKTFLWIEPMKEASFMSIVEGDQWGSRLLVIVGVGVVGTAVVVGRGCGRETQVLPGARHTLRAEPLYQILYPAPATNLLCKLKSRSSQIRFITFLHNFFDLCHNFNLFHQFGSI